jgi:hypothetical protein
MTGPLRVLRAAELAADLAEDGIPATSAVHELTGQLPAVLIGPPTLDWTEGTMAGPQVTWTLQLVASTTDPDQAWEELDQLLTDLARVRELERAAPAALALTAGSDPLPAYTVTLIETLED